MDAATTVGIPMGWFLTSIGALCGIIATLAGTIFKIQGERLQDERSRTKETIEALTENAQALETMTGLLKTIIQVRGV